MNKIKHEDNIIKKLWNKLTIQRWDKALKVTILCMLFMVLSEGLFEIPVIADFFGSGLIEGKSGWVVYVIVWLVMFAQVAIIPIPALPILTACNQIPGLVANGEGILNLFSFQTLGFIALIVSATLLGAIASYWIGRTFGKPAVKWIAGSDKDYKIWSKKFNGKIGKWAYASTVLLPIFPDDLLSLVAGAVKMNFAFYTIVNAICKTIGLYCMLIFMRIPGIDIFFGKEGSGFPVALLIYSIILISAIIGKLIINNKIKIEQPKQIKLGVIKEKLLYYINNIKSASKELIIDYNLNKKLKTYLANKIIIHTYYTVNNFNNKQNIRIIIECNPSNYNQIIFDKEYELTEKYDTLIKDIKSLNI